MVHIADTAARRSCDAAELSPGWSSLASKSRLGHTSGSRPSRSASAAAARSSGIAEDAPCRTSVAAPNISSDFAACRGAPAWRARSSAAPAAATATAGRLPSSATSVRTQSNRTAARQPAADAGLGSGLRRSRVRPRRGAEQTPQLAHKPTLTDSRRLAEETQAEAPGSGHRSLALAPMPTSAAKDIVCLGTNERSEHDSQ